jgi:hemolysin III
MTKNKLTYYSPLEEKINIYSHALGLMLSLVGAFFLMSKAVSLHSSIHIVSYAVYAASLIILYSASSSYHISKKEKLRRRLNVFDHAAIYFLIAGTYIPFSFIGIGGKWGTIIALIVTVTGVSGVLLKLFFTGRFKLVSTISYVIMGSIVLIAFKPLINNASPEAVRGLFIGGGFYLLGAVLYSIKKIPLNHAIFHLFVLGGSATHFLTIYFYV